MVSAPEANLMEARKSLTCSSFAILAALCVLGCADGDRIDAKLDVAAPPDEPAPGDEEAWLRSLQRVRQVTREDDGTVTTEELDPDEVRYDVGYYCEDLYPSITSGTICQQILMRAQMDTCMARTFLAIAGAQATPVEVRQSDRVVSWDQTTEEAAAALATIAADHAARALKGERYTSGYGTIPVDTLRGVLPQLTTPHSTCRPAANQWGTPYGSAYGGKSIATLLARVAGEAYQLGVNAYERAVQATVNASDKLRSSTPSPSLAAQRATTGTLLSRAAAAHLLVGGEPGFAGSTAPLCIEPLTPGAVSALRLLRDSGVEPLILADAQNQAVLPGVPPLTPVRERLAEFYGIEELIAPGASLESYYDIKTEDIYAARVYYSQELAAFSRSLTAKLPPDPAHPMGFRRFAGSSTAPQPLPVGAWAVRAAHRTFEPQFTSASEPWLADAVPSLKNFVGSTHSTIRSILRSTDTFSNPADNPTETRAEVLGGLAGIIGSNEYQGQLRAQLTSANNLDVYVYDATAGDRIRVVVGEDGLRCAVDGTIEGADCSDASGNEDEATFPCSVLGGNPTLSCLTAVLLTSQGNTSNYGAAVYTRGQRATSSNASLITGLKRLYFVKPRTLDDPEKPGNFVLLGGLNLHTVGVTTLSPITPTIDERVDEILAPSTSNCAQSATSCTGIAENAPLPLEDELTEDGNGIENSWQHYLGLARQAADEAELLGKEYVSQALTELGARADLEVRQEEQQQHADALLSEVQDMCGTAIDSRSLLQTLSTLSSQATEPSNLSAFYYNPTTPCSGTATPTACTEGYDCVGGGCLFHLANIESKSTSADAIRLAQCLSPEKADFVTLGSVPVCVATRADNPNDVCPNVEGLACPTLPDPATDACPEPPETKAYLAEALGYFSGTPVVDPPTSACAAFRRARTRAATGEDLTLNEQEIETIRKSNVLLPENLKEFVGRVWWKAKYGGYATISEDPVDRFTTGDMSTGAASTSGGLPCVTTVSSTPLGGCTDSQLTEHQGLFCDQVACTDPTERAKLNYRLLRATIAAHLILGREHEETNQYGHFLLLPVPAAFQGNPCTGAFRAPAPGVTTKDDKTLKFYTKQETILEPGNVPVQVCNAFPDYGQISNRPPITREGYWSYERRVATPGAAWIQENGAIISTATGSRVGFTSARGYPEIEDWDTAQIQNALIGGLSEAPDSAGLKWTLDILNGTRSHGDFGATWPTYEIRKIWGAIVHLDNYDILNGTLDPEALLDGVELLCELSLDGGDEASAASASTAGVPEGVSAYIKALAERIESSASGVVFARVPRIALDAMREASPTGAFPALGGEMAEQISTARQALLSTRQAIPVLAGALQQLGTEFEIWEAQQKLNRLEDQLVDWSTASVVADRLAVCANSMVTPGDRIWKMDFGASALINCANSAAQIVMALKRAALQKDISDTELEIQRQGFIQRVNDIARNLESVSISLSESYEAIDRSLAGIERLQKRARVAMARALHAASYQSQKQAQYIEGVSAVAAAYRGRYDRAMVNAKKMAFLAKRAIEQRLGVSLSEMREDLPLVDAPQSWEGSLCTATAVTSEDASGGEEAPPDFATYVNGFIGDYVTNLSNVVESYRLVHNFHEGSDTAIVSLRDDVFGVRAPCASTARNLFENSGRMDVAPWQPLGCAEVSWTEGDTTVTSDTFNCVSVISEEPPPDTGLVAPVRGAMGYRLRLGDGTNCASSSPACGWRSGAALAQTIALDAGRYRLSWSTKDSHEPNPQGGADVGVVKFRKNGVPDAPTLYYEDFDYEPGTPWTRVHVDYEVVDAGLYDIGFGLTNPGNPPSLTPPATVVTLAAPMLEVLPPVGAPLSDYHGTNADGEVLLNTCEDSTGEHFRARHWKPGCVRLCDDGFSSTCATGPEHCYREASFTVFQEAIQSGQIMRFSGFARGNFNYRIDEVALNFVGANVRNCEDSEQPSTCYSAGFVPYSLQHNGPFLVRNHAGDDFRAYLFDGRIEHARGLGAERYLTNPLSSTDQDLLADFYRRELRGRPLDGTFVVRVWEEDGVDFDSIEDVQLVLRYRYWTENE